MLELCANSVPLQHKQSLKSLMAAKCFWLNFDPMNVSRVRFEWTPVVSFVWLIYASNLVVEFYLSLLLGRFKTSISHSINWALKPLQSRGDPALLLDWERIQGSAGHMTVMNLCRIKEAEYQLVKVLIMFSTLTATAILAFNAPTSMSMNPSVNTIFIYIYMLNISLCSLIPFI